MRRYERREELRDGNRTVPNAVGFRSHHHDHIVGVCDFALSRGSAMYTRTARASWHGFMERSRAMAKSLSVFLCSTFVDLAQERQRVLEAIRLLQLQHDSMEFFGARPGSPLETCLEEVRKSDVLVILVGHRYGSLVPDLPLSFPEAEYEEGFSLGKHCLAYLVDENVPVLPRNMEQDAEGIRRLQRWKEVLQRRHTVARFSNSADLAVRVTADLAREVQKFETASDATHDADLQARNRTREALRAFTEVNVEGRALPEVAQRLREIPAVVEVMLTFGFTDMMVVTSAPDLDQLMATIRAIGSTLGVSEASTLIVDDSAAAAAGLMKGEPKG